MYGAATQVIVNNWALNMTGMFATASISNDNLFTTTIQKLGTTTSQSITVTNVGQYPLTITSASDWVGASEDYAIDPNTPLPITIKAGGNAQITVDFTPTDFGLRQAQFNLISNGLNPSTLSGQTITVFLFGTGEAPLMTSSNAGAFFLQERELVRLDTVRYLRITERGEPGIDDRAMEQQPDVASSRNGRHYHHELRRSRRQFDERRK